MSVEILFYQWQSDQQMHYHWEDVVLQVSLDLHDSCIRSDLSFLILRVEVHGVLRDAYDHWRAPWNQDCLDHQL
jgi:hypothetical protein